jgi:hypothetical protein
MLNLEVTKYQFYGDTHSIKFLNHCHGRQIYSVKYYLFRLYIHFLNFDYVNLKRISVIDVFTLFDINTFAPVSDYGRIRFSMRKLPYPTLVV